MPLIQLKPFLFYLQANGVFLFFCLCVSLVKLLNMIKFYKSSKVKYNYLQERQASYIQLQRSSFLEYLLQLLREKIKCQPGPGLKIIKIKFCF